MNAPLGHLLRQIDDSAGQAKAASFKAWVTFLSDDQPALDPKLVEWSRKLVLRTLPLGVFEDRKGPPSYRLHAEADVTVLLYVNQRVVANFAFRQGELTEQKIKEVMEALAGIAPAKNR